MSKTTRATDTVKICLAVLGEVEVDDNIDGLDIDATREEVRAHKVTADTTAEVVEDTITM